MRWLAINFIASVALVVWAVTWPIAWVNQAARRILVPYD